MNKFLVFVLLIALIVPSAHAEYYYAEEEDPALFVTNCNEWISVWAEPKSGAERVATLPKGACIFHFREFSDDYVIYDHDGIFGYISLDYLTPYPDGYNEYPPLYVTNCNEWISVWEDPASGSRRLDTLPLGTEIYDWLPYDRDFIWYEQDGVYGYVSWDYLTYNP